LYDLKHSKERKYDADELDLHELLEQHWLRDVGISVFNEKIFQYPLSMMLLYYSFDKVEQPGLPSADDKAVTPKPRSPRHQPTQATPPRTHQRARLEMEHRRPKRLTK
jgi:hypothetical protein